VKVAGFEWKTQENLTQEVENDTHNKYCRCSSKHMRAQTQRASTNASAPHIKCCLGSHEMPVCVRIVPLHDAARALAGRCPLHAQAPTCPDTALHTHEYPRSLSRAKTDTARWIPSDHMRRLMAWLLQHPTVVTALPPRKGAPS
jgi:hypothetical protein